MSKPKTIDLTKLIPEERCRAMVDTVDSRYPLKNYNFSTLEECIKEWEEKGFEIISHTRERFEVYKQWIERINHCSYHTSAKIVIEKDYFYIVGQFNEYTQLLIKTLKALEAKDE